MPRHALIVEDDPDVSAILANLVRARGFEPVVLDRGREVEAAVRTYQPAFILLDLMLSDIDGFTICERLKLDRDTNLIPILMVTALNDARNHLRGIRVGANGYVAKPFQPAQIDEAIADALAWRRRHEEGGVQGEIQFDIRSELSYLQEINDMLADIFANTPLNESQVKELKQAVMEMGSNAIEWGHRKNADLPLKITYRIHPTHIVLVIRDQGPGFNPNQIPHAAQEENPIGHLEVRQELGIREGGFGIMLARGLVDAFSYNDAGNEVTLVKRFDSPLPGGDGASATGSGVASGSEG